MFALPSPLPENVSLAFTGEAAWTPALITSAQAEKFSTARNSSGRPNSDVLRCFIGNNGHHLHTRWQIDFPAHYTAQEAALHERPFALLRKRIPDPTGVWWVNPHAQPLLRLALARLDRFLALALDAPEPAWTWLESDHLPDDSLLVVTRDDDFTRAVLQSSAFAAWWRAHFQRRSPTQAVESFPFPWAPFSPLGALTREQQELRSAASRAALSSDGEQIDSSVAAAYGWPAHLAPAEMLSALYQLHGRRLAARHQTGLG